MEAHQSVSIHGWGMWKGISLSDTPLSLLLSQVGNLKFCHLSHKPLLPLGEKILCALMEWRWQAQTETPCFLM